MLWGSKPTVEWLVADRGYDADRFRAAPQDEEIRACIPGRKPRRNAVWHDKRRYNRRTRGEIMFRCLENWRRIATRYDHRPKVFPYAMALAAAVILWP